MKFLVLLLCIVPVAFNLAQTTISGTVSDQRGSPIPLANIILLDTYDGATTDINGSFSFQSTETGSKTIAVRFVGFHEYQAVLSLVGKPITITIQLKEQINELEAVTISAGSFTASDESRRTVFKAIDIATTAGATADIAGALNTLPGTQKVGESGRLFVRGGDGNETRTFIDGTAVLNAYSPSAPNAPSRGRFLPFMFKGTSFSTGGYSAEYGQALSSVLALDSKDNTEQTRTDIGILSVGGDVAHTQAWKNGSVAGKLQYTNIRPYFGLINQEVDWKTPPASTEGVVAFRQRTGEHSILKFYGNYNNSDFSLYRHDIDNPARKQLYVLDNKYRYGNASYKGLLNDQWLLRGGISYTLNKDAIRIDSLDVTDKEYGVHAKTVLEGTVSEHIELKAGAEVIIRDYQYTLANNTSDFNENITALFVETDLYASNKFVTRGGIRSEYNSMLQEVSIDPRFSVAYKTGAAGQVSLAYGKFRQSPKNELLRYHKQLSPEKSTHYIINYQRIADDRTLRVEGYYKTYDDLVTTTLNSASNDGHGYARGFELFWRDNKSVRNADYWISYSFLDTKRLHLAFPVSSMPAFASRHNFSVVYKHFITQWKSQLGTTYSFSSGRPYTNPNKSSFNSDRTPYYTDLSFNWSYLPKPYLIIHLSCTNVLGRDNIFGYEFSQHPNEAGEYKSRAIRQPAKRFLFLGIFITLSKEKSVNQLPSI